MLYKISGRDMTMISSYYGAALCPLSGVKMFFSDSPYLSIFLYILMGFGFGFCFRFWVLALVTSSIVLLSLYMIGIGTCRDGAGLVCLAYMYLFGTMLISMWITALGVRRAMIMSGLARIKHLFIRK